jgi:hypothetical protein
VAQMYVIYAFLSCLQPCYGPALRGLGDLARESGDYGAAVVAYKVGLRCYPVDIVLGSLPLASWGGWN